MLKTDIPRCPHRKLMLTAAGVTDGMPGDGLALIASAALPDAGQTRQTLLRLRREHRFSRGKLAALLAVSPHTLRRWEEGKRRPCATARRVVQLVERLYFRPGDFPTEPLQSVLSALQPDVRDSLARMRERKAKASRVGRTSANRTAEPQG
jgi:transcriptional regulator with XRE-family HTH domain